MPMGQRATASAGAQPPGGTAEWVTIWRRLVGARIRADWQYRMSFLLFLASQATIAVFDLAVIAVLFGHVDSIAGWSGREVVLLFGLATLPFGVADVVVSPVEMASRHIKAGSFDRFLLRPVPTLIHVLASEFALRRAGKIVQPVVVLAAALAVSGIDWGLEAVVLLPLAIVSGAVIFAAIWVITSSISFWTVDSQEVANAFTYGGGLATEYPLGVLNSWLRRIVTYVVPLAFVAYLPAARLLGHDRALGMPSAVAWAAPAVAAVTALVARSVWGLAIRHYRSTGS